MRAALVPLILVQFGGCLWGSAGCEVFVPAPAPGAHFTYEGEGMWSTSTNLVITDMRVFGQPESQGGLIHLDGLRLTFAFASAPAPVMSYDGTPQEALQVTYWLSDGDMRHPVADEWISMADGSTVQTSDRAINASLYHQTLFRAHTKPSAYYAALFWGRSWREGDTLLHVSAPVEFSNRSQGEPVTYEAVVVRTHSEEVCRMDVDLSIRRPGTEAVVRISFEDGVPMHVAHSYKEPTRGRESTTLVEWMEGAGAGPPPFAPVERDSILRSVPGAEAYAACCAGFPTTLDKAKQVAREDAEMAAWLDAHPAAGVVGVEHRLGKPDSDTIDLWMITWSDGKATLRAFVYHQKQTLPLVDPEFRVQTMNHATLPTSLPESHTRLDEIARVGTEHFRTPIEVISCGYPFPDAACGVGTHASTGFGKAEFPTFIAEASTKPSLKVDPSAGLLYQDLSYGDHGLALPVPFPSS